MDEEFKSVAKSVISNGIWLKCDIGDDKTIKFTDEISTIDFKNKYFSVIYHNFLLMCYFSDFHKTWDLIPDNL